MRFNGRKENLHSLWDTALVELEQGTPVEIAARIQNSVSSDDHREWQQGIPAEWALESLAIVRAQVYRLPASGEITASYTEAARGMIRTRLAQAGARLAWMLNETLQLEDSDEARTRIAVSLLCSSGGSVTVNCERPPGQTVTQVHCIYCSNFRWEVGNYRISNLPSCPTTWRFLRSTYGYLQR